MYETSCTCEILHRAPHVHRVNFGLDDHSSCINTFFYLYFCLSFFSVHHLGHNGFELYTYLCMLDSADTYCTLKPEETVYRLFFGFFYISFNIMSDNMKHLKHYIYSSQTQSRGCGSMDQRGRKCNQPQCFNFAYILYLRLICCSKKKCQ